MTLSLVDQKTHYQRSLDKKGKSIAKKLKSLQPATKLLLDYTKELYKSQKTHCFTEPGKFSSAYHSPITSDLEFLLARVFYHYIKMNHLNWEVSLRRQEKKSAPDIRIHRGQKTLAIIEVKAKASWMQQVLSKVRLKHYQARRRNDESKSDPRKQIKDIQNTVKKYSKTFNLKRERIFIILPSLAGVHRKKDNTKIKDYYNEFLKNFKLPKRNFILLSENPSLNLAKENISRKDYEETNRFEKIFMAIF